eukprot:2839003-Amphidinium_carterae.1
MNDTVNAHYTGVTHRSKDVDRRYKCNVEPVNTTHSDKSVARLMMMWRWLCLLPLYSRCRKWTYMREAVDLVVQVMDNPRRHAVAMLVFNSSVDFKLQYQSHDVRVPSTCRAHKIHREIEPWDVSMIQGTSIGLRPCAATMCSTCAAGQVDVLHVVDKRSELVLREVEVVVLQHGPCAARSGIGSVESGATRAHRQSHKSCSWSGPRAATI